MWLKTLVLPLVAAAAAVQAGSVQNGFEACRVSISRTSTDTTLLSHAFDSATDSPSRDSPVLTLDSSFKLSCTFDAPLHSAFLSFSPVHAAPESSESHYSVPLRVKESKGKHQVKLDYPLSTRAPTKLLQFAPGSISYTLHVATLQEGHLDLPLGTFTFADTVVQLARDEEDRLIKHDAPAEWDVRRWNVLPEQSWTFGEIETGPSLAWGVLGALFSLGLPAATLAFLLSSVMKDLKWQSLSGSAVGLVAGLASIEALVVAYWYHFRIFTILPLIAVTSVFTAFLGRSALRERASSR